MTIFCPNGHENSDSHHFCQTCGSQISVPITHQITGGVILGDRYRVTKQIGQGGFGRTYLCEDVNRFNEPCVLKEFAPQLQGTAFLTKAQELFEREAGVMYRLQHPQIPMFREMFRVNRAGVGQLFLVQDYVAGSNYLQLLRQKMQQGKTFTETEIIEFLTQILPVLGYIHAHGVIHRDISPDNLIKRDRDGLPVLIDFGGVKQVAVNVATQYTAATVEQPEMSTRLGKVGYAPNEQMQRGVVSPQSDLYALAATTLVLLTGKEPPDLIDPQNFTWNWREWIDLSPNLASILDRMLQLRPNDRFASAQDILTALQSGNSTHYSPFNPQTPPTAPVQPPLSTPKSQVATVMATPQHQQTTTPPTQIATESSLMTVLGKTWISIVAIGGAIGLGWLVASLTIKRPEPVATTIDPNPPQPLPSESISPDSTPSNPIEPTPTPTPAIPRIAPATNELIFPAALAAKGVNDRIFRDAVKQVFISQNPQIKTLNLADLQVKNRVDTLATDLGDKLDRQLSRKAARGIGQYSSENPSTWKSEVNRVHLGERALIDLTDAKYRSITNLPSQPAGLRSERFLNTAIGQIYLAAMFDRVQAIKSKQAMDEIIFPIGGTSGTVRGTLQPGEGKAYIASLVGGQDIGVNIIANQPTNLSIYPPTHNLPTILAPSPTNNWSGKTKTNGYHEFVIVSHSDRPIQYELKLTASDLKPNNSQDNRIKSSNLNPHDNVGF